MDGITYLKMDGKRKKMIIKEREMDGINILPAEGIS